MQLSFLNFFDMDKKMKRKSPEFRSQASRGGVGGKKQSRYFGDPRLISRIEQYLRTNSHITNINLSVMANQLQKQYSEYARKKNIPFRLSVEKAYGFITSELRSKPPDEEDDQNAAFTKRRKKQSEGNASDMDSSSSESDDSKSFSSDFDKYKSYKDQNSMNNALSDLYRKSPKLKTGDDNLSVIVETGLPYFIDKSGNLPNNDTETQNISNNTLPVESSRQVQESSSGVTTPIKNINKLTNQSEKSVKTNSKKLSKLKEGKKKEKDKVQIVQKSTKTFADVGGNEKTLSEVCKLLIHMKHAEVYNKLGVIPPRGFLLHGPPGCGKTLLANAIAGELDLPMIKLAATEVVSGVSGESEEKLRDIFSQAISCAPCILFLDEIDAITPKRESASKDMERRIVSQLLTCMDDLSNETESHVLVVGATNRPDSLDPALRRAGRFDREICLGIPDENARERILHVLCKNLRLEEGFSFAELAHQTPGYVGADLNSLAREAAMTAVNRILATVQKNAVIEPLINESQTVDPPAEENLNGINDIVQEPSKRSEQLSVTSIMSWLRDKPPLTDEQLSSLYISMDDFRTALRYVQPSAKREGFATIPDVTWDDIGALADVRDELQLAILAPVRHREQFALLGLSNPPGILLAGPPGCGKTLLAKAIANESGINFISVKGPELLNMYVGESEKAVRQVFQRARNSAPCVIFFDELDALCPKRSQNAESGSGARVVNQMLTEMDGLEERKQVFIMAATNRPDIIDPAILRPGRLDKILYVGLPTPEDRVEILRTITKNGTKPKLHEVCLETVANDVRCNCFTGADLAALVREASVVALKAFIRLTDVSNQGSQGNDGLFVGKEHFETAFSKVRPSVNQKDRLFYDSMRERLSICNKS